MSEWNSTLEINKKSQSPGRVDDDDDDDDDDVSILLVTG